MIEPPGNDAAPLAGGAGVNVPSFTHNIRLLLTQRAWRNALAGASYFAGDRIADLANKLRDLVLAFIVSEGSHGASDDEGESALWIKPHTYMPRRSELVAFEMLADSGRRRHTPNGRRVAAWATPNHMPNSYLKSTWLIKVEGAVI